MEAPLRTCSLINTVLIKFIPFDKKLICMNIFDGLVAIRYDCEIEFDQTMGTNTLVRKDTVKLHESSIIIANYDNSGVSKRKKL